MIAEMIGDPAATIECCSSARQTVSACLRHSPDLVIVLAVAPFVDGSEFIRRIRLSAGRRPAVYVVSWQQSEHLVLSLLDCGVDQYLTFPVCMSRLQRKVATSNRNAART